MHVALWAASGSSGGVAVDSRAALVDIDTSDALRTMKAEIERA